MSFFNRLIEKYNITDSHIAYAIDYLKYYGYLDRVVDISVRDIYAAVKNFQEFSNINLDGEIGPQTLGMMSQKRCGVRDKAFLGRRISKWNKKELTYYIQGWIGGSMSKLEQRAILRQAWYNWERVCDIHLYETNSKNANIIIDIGQGAIHDFDGPGGTLAWAYLPRGNDSQLLMRFDLGETWAKLDSRKGILLLNVAAHEFGHLLGLDHSNKKNALMAPFYNPKVGKPQAADDITRVQMRYGKPKNRINRTRFKVV